MKSRRFGEVTGTRQPEVLDAVVLIGVGVGLLLDTEPSVAQPIGAYPCLLKPGSRALAIYGRLGAYLGPY